MYVLYRSVLERCVAESSRLGDGEMKSTDGRVSSAQVASFSSIFFHSAERCQKRRWQFGLGFQTHTHTLYTHTQACEFPSFQTNKFKEPSFTNLPTTHPNFNTRDSSSRHDLNLKITHITNEPKRLNKTAAFKYKGVAIFI